MRVFNNGKTCHGSAAVQDGELKGATDTDYFYFFCPKCPGSEILRLLDYGVIAEEAVNPYNDQCSSTAKSGFRLAFKLHCEVCSFEDFVKISNLDLQGGQLAL